MLGIRNRLFTCVLRTRTLLPWTIHLTEERAGFSLLRNQSSGSYDWFIPNLPSDEALIRVRDQNVSCRVDESDALFSIVSEVEVEVPNGGEEYQAIVSPFTSTGIYLMDDGTMVTDGGRFFDSGGESGNYSNTNYTKYFWPSTASNELRMSFTRFHTYNG